MSVLGCRQGYQEMLVSCEQRHSCYLGYQYLPCVRVQDTTGKGEPNSGSLLDSEVTGTPLILSVLSGDIFPGLAVSSLPPPIRYLCDGDLL